MQRHSVTSLETARSLANGPIEAGGWGRIPRELQRLLSLTGYASTGGVCRRSLTAGKILFTWRQTCSLYLVLWLCGLHLLTCILLIYNVFFCIKYYLLLTNFHFTHLKILHIASSLAVHTYILDVIPMIMVLKKKRPLRWDSTSDSSVADHVCLMASLPDLCTEGSGFEFCCNEWLFNI